MKTVAPIMEAWEQYQADLPEEYRSNWIGPQFADGWEAAITRIFPLIIEALPHVQATAEAEHMLDGFGQRKELPVDELVKRMKSVLS